MPFVPWFLESRFTRSTLTGGNAAVCAYFDTRSTNNDP
jgi:hypothetical protein